EYTSIVSRAHLSVTSTPIILTTTATAITHSASHELQLDIVPPTNVQTLPQPTHRQHRTIWRLLVMESNAEVVLKQFRNLSSADRFEFISGFLDSLAPPELRRLHHGFWNRRYGLDILSELPHEIACHVLSFLPVSSLPVAGRVSKRWKEIVDDPVAWSNAFKATIGLFNTTKPSAASLPATDYKTDVKNLLTKVHTWTKAEMEIGFVPLPVASRYTALKLVCFPDEQKERVVVGTGSRQLIVYENFSDPQQVAWWEAHSISVLEGTPEIIVTGSYDQTIQVWDWEGKRLQTMNGHLNSIACLALHGEVLFSAGTDKSLIAWNWRSGKRLKLIPKANVSSLIVADNVLISASFDGTVNLHSIDPPLQLLARISVAATITHLDYSNSMLVATVPDGLEVGRLDLRNFDQKEFENGLCFVQAASAGMVRWAVGGYLFVVARMDGLELWSVKNSHQSSKTSQPWTCSFVRTLRDKSAGVVCAFETDTNGLWVVTKQSAFTSHSCYVPSLPGCPWRTDGGYIERNGNLVKTARFNAYEYVDTLSEHD
ncbi:hypothetical protein SeMB42_g06751, partial [Synchytrium endobioticum]